MAHFKSNCVAFFDVDGTLIRTPSMCDFISFLSEYLKGTMLCTYFVNMLKQLLIFQSGNMERVVLNKWYYYIFSGFKYSFILNMCRLWGETLLVRYPDIWIESTLYEFDKHKQRGEKCVLVSGSFVELIKPIKELLNADEVLATQLEVDCNGYVTGEIIGPQMIGPGKAFSIGEYMLQQEVNREMCVSYGDHESDLPMMYMTGHAIVVGSNPYMQQVAMLNNWPCLDAEIKHRI